MEKGGYATPQGSRDLPKQSVGGKLQTSLSANETCGWCRSGVSPESCGVGWLPGRHIFRFWLVHVSQAIQNFIPLIHLNGILLQD